MVWAESEGASAMLAKLAPSPVTTWRRLKREGMFIEGYQSGFEDDFVLITVLQFPFRPHLARTTFFQTPLKKSLSALLSAIRLK
jgi:hypothetical protein